MAREAVSSATGVMIVAERYFRLLEVANILGVSPKTVKRWVKEGVLFAVHVPRTRFWRIPESALRRLFGDTQWEFMKEQYLRQRQQQQRQPWGWHRLPQQQGGSQEG